ncbi:MAG: phosphoadenosine phosphosulfate reductase domain-containing protein [Methanoculleaceae archaeon]
MSAPFLGAMHLFWCDRCHTPVLGRRCGCGAGTRPCPVTPPGDLRPAFPADVEHINRIFGEHFGSPLIPEGHLALLNKVPAVDRMEEIIMGGCVVAAIRYDQEKGSWEPLPRREAAPYLSPEKRWIMIDRDAVEPVAGGAGVLAPGVVAVDDAIQAGDEVLVLNPEREIVAAARARVDAGEARRMERGLVARTRKTVRGRCVPGPAGWDDAVAANRQIIESRVGEAERFVQKTAARHPDLPVTVSFSGGKDSLATLLIVMDVLGPVPLIFADTGMELPETYRHVEEVAGKFGLEVFRCGDGSIFWEVFEREGPPSLSNKWCCTHCKLEPVRRLIEKEFGECLSFIGQRQYESARRRKSGRIWRNRQVPNQISAAPLQHWTALHVWLYLFSRNAPFNPLYTRRMDRIGCYICPSSDMATIQIISEQYPEEWRRWEERVAAWKGGNGG